MKKMLEDHIRSYFDTRRKSGYGIKPYLLKDGKTHPVAIVVPGGGYRRVASYVEGHPFAKKLNAMGYHAVVVFYHVKGEARFPAPQDDLARAVREVYAHADEWKIDMRGYSVWGASAGGHLVASFGTESMGYVKYGLPKPGALVLSYPVISMGEKAHVGSKNNLLGENPTEKAIAETSVDLNVTENYPPTFLWWGSIDDCVDPENSRLLKAALEGNRIPCQCIEYEGVNHGVGIGRGLACEGWFEKAVDFWMAHR